MFNEAGVMGSRWSPAIMDSSFQSIFSISSAIEHIPHRHTTGTFNFMGWAYRERGGEIKLNKLTVKKDWPMKMGVCCSHLSLATCGM
ncbi:hypothetical protein OUZ56_010787 [Daphnia magna]|uniref:Uncharacterized protein n=1 Tax=Daphnia magna TaxID=35525 RepID=A0ABQ9YYH9_9CRUS|nr:hypothetical protein OUZ56_010787 [Daphnia magna]